MIEVVVKIMTINIEIIEETIKTMIIKDRKKITLNITKEVEKKSL